MKEKKTASAPSRAHKSSGEAPICENLSFAAKEAFKRLRTNIVMSFPREDTSCQLIGVTSAQPSDGKSTIALNLAYSLAELEKKVLLIDDYADNETYGKIKDVLKDLAITFTEKRQ